MEPRLGPPVVTTYERPMGGLNYAKRVLEIMGEMVADYVHDPSLREVADRLKAPTPIQTLRDVFRYLKGRIPYVPDPEGVELIRSPRRTILAGEGGDCDDLTVAAATILKIKGFLVVLRAVAWRSEDFTHVFCVVILNGEEIPFDLTFPALGEQHPPLRILDFPMIQRFDDAVVEIGDSPLLKIHPGTVQVLAGDLLSPDPDSSRRAYFLLRSLYPSEIQTWFEKGVQASQRNPLPVMLEFGDLNGWLDSIGKFIGGALDTITGGVAGMLYEGISEGLKWAGILSSGDKTKIPQDIRSALASRGGVMNLGSIALQFPSIAGRTAGKGDEAAGVYGTVWTKSPEGLPYGSFSGANAFDTGFMRMGGKSGTGWQNIGKSSMKGPGQLYAFTATGQELAPPGLYDVTFFSDGNVYRYDLVPGSVTFAPNSPATPLPKAGVPDSPKTVKVKLPNGMSIDVDPETAKQLLQFQNLTGGAPGGSVPSQSLVPRNVPQSPATSQPRPAPVSSSELPPWVLPVAIGGAALLLLRK